MREEPGETAVSDPTTASRSRARQGAVPEFVRQAWPADPRHLVGLRAEVRGWLTPFALDGDTEDDLVLAVGEAASNSVEHAYAPPAVAGIVALTFWIEDHAICIEVVDHGVWRPPVEQSNGRGLGIPMMQRLTAFVLIRHDSRGTRVLLRHPLPDAPVRACHASRGGHMPA